VAFVAVGVGGWEVFLLVRRDDLDGVPQLQAIWADLTEGSTVEEVAVSDETAFEVACELRAWAEQSLPLLVGLGLIDPLLGLKMRAEELGERDGQAGGGHFNRIRFGPGFQKAPPSDVTDLSSNENNEEEILDENSADEHSAQPPSVGESPSGPCPVCGRTDCKRAPDPTLPTLHWTQIQALGEAGLLTTLADGYHMVYMLDPAVESGLRDGSIWKELRR